MKKKLLILVALIITFITFILLFYNSSNSLYIVKVSVIDKNSPDRLLKVYLNDKEIEFDSIYYLDDVFICNNNMIFCYLLLSVYYPLS